LTKLNYTKNNAWLRYYRDCKTYGFEQPGKYRDEFANRKRSDTVGTWDDDGPVENLKFTGNFRQLQLAVLLANFDGVWSSSPHVHVFRCSTRAIMNWAPRTGTLWFQGNPHAAHEFRRVLIPQLRAAHKM
jgi:hypothetical protein